MRLLFVALTFIASANCVAHEPVYTRIEGQLLKAGMPFRNALVVSCADVSSYLDASSCDHPISVKTDTHGRFAFVQATGYPSCTVCPCSSSGVPVMLSCDPMMGFWFRVLADEYSRDFEVRGHGYGITNTIRLTCDVRPSEGASGSSRPIQRERFHLPLLSCK